MRKMTKWTAGLLIVSLTTLTMGCQTMSEHKVASGATIGALAGAAGGALIDKHHRGRGALIGAAAGAAIGGGVGYYLDRKAKRFQEVEDVQVTTVPEATGQGETYEPPRVNLRISDQLLFERGSSALKPGGVQKIQEIANVIREDADSVVIVKGYTSSEGSDQYNTELSQRRADVIKNQMIACMVDASRIQAVGMGESNPIADNSTEAGRAQNRRVEIDVIPRSEVR